MTLTSWGARADVRCKVHFLVHFRAIFRLKVDLFEQGLTTRRRREPRKTETGTRGATVAATIDGANVLTRVLLKEAFIHSQNNTCINRALTDSRTSPRNRRRSRSHQT